MESNKKLRPCNGEFDKTIKYNGHWYHLRAVFDGEDAGLFDFDQALDESVDSHSRALSFVADMNKVDPVILTKYFNALNTNSTTDEQIIKIQPGLTIFTGEQMVAQLGDEVHKDQDMQRLLERFVKQINGYAGEAVVGMVADKAKKHDYHYGNDQLDALSAIALLPPEASNEFPDAILSIGEGRVPVDLKACYDKKCNSAGSSNRAIITAILESAILAKRQSRPFIDILCGYCKELRGMLLFVSTQPADTGLSLVEMVFKPVLECLALQPVSDSTYGLLKSKRANSEGAVNFYRDNGFDIEFVNAGGNSDVPKIIVQLIENFCNMRQPESQSHFVDLRKLKKNLGCSHAPAFNFDGGLSIDGIEELTDGVTPFLRGFFGLQTPDIKDPGVNGIL